MNKYNREAGYTLVGVLLIFTILTVLGISLIMLSLTSIKTSTAERDNQSVYYIAEAGVNFKMNEIKNKVDEIHRATEQQIEEMYINNDDLEENMTTEEINTIARNLFYDNLKSQLLQLNNSEAYQNFEPVDGKHPKAEIDIEASEEKEGQFIITSTGEIAEQKRTIVKNIEVAWENEYEVGEEKGFFELPPLTVFTSGNMTLTNGPIEGSIGTLSTEKYAIKVGNGVLKVKEGKIYVPYIEHSEENRTCINDPNNANTYRSYSVQRPTWENNVPCPVEVEKMWELPLLPAFPELPNDNKTPEDDFVNGYQVIRDGDLLINDSRSNNYELQMDGNFNFRNIVFNSNRNLTINIGDSDKYIIVDHLNIENGHIKLKGTGKLTLYVKNKITMGSGSTINDQENIKDNEHIKNLDIFYSGNSQVNLSGNQKIYGSLYAKRANLDLTGSGSIYGNIFTGGNTFQISGGSKVETQLILAPYADVTISGGGSIYGKIISKTFTHNSGGHVIDGEPFIIEGPISPSALESGTGSKGKKQVIRTNRGLSISTESIQEITN